MIGREDVDLIPHVRIVVIYVNDGSWGGVECSCSGHRDVHDILQ